MESAQAKIRYIVETKVSSLKERFVDLYVSGFGSETVFRKESLGWFVFFVGSYEALSLGADKPDLEPGDKIIITIQKG